MKRKLESDEELDEHINSGDVDELRDQLLEQELSNKGKFDDTKTGDEFVRVVKREFFNGRLLQFTTFVVANKLTLFILDSSISFTLFFLQVQ